MKTSDFDYVLPPELIAQTPIEPRSDSRLLVASRTDGSITHRRFSEITDYLKEGDVLVFNNSRVIPARLKGTREGGGEAEILLLRRLEVNLWEGLVKPARRLKAGAVIEISPSTSSGQAGSKAATSNLQSRWQTKEVEVLTDGDACATVTARVVETREGGGRILQFSDETLLPRLGEIPLPPYIHAPLPDPARYQTVYADAEGSAAAPTAGLHFTPELIKQIEAKGVRCLFTTLHIGLDTFRPVHEEDPLEHKIHKEYGILSQETAGELSRARREGRRIICVGTTSVRLVEAAAQQGDGETVPPFAGWVDLFILPGHRFNAVDAVITNFHLPRSTLLMLVSAFAGKDLIEKAYREAILGRYRFYSFGDAMLIL